MIFLDQRSPVLVREELKVSGDLPPPLDVIFVGAHPDDVEISCGGTIYSLVQQGYRVGIVDLTDGEPTPLSPSPEVRWSEAQKASEVLGSNIDGFSTCLIETDGRFRNSACTCQEFRFWRPNTVIGFGNKTPMASPDHYQAMQITDAAVFYSRLTKWDEHFDGLLPHTIDRQLSFRLAFDFHPIVGSESQLTVDIGHCLDKKLEAIHCYATQFSRKESLCIRSRSWISDCRRSGGRVFSRRSLCGNTATRCT